MIHQRHTLQSTPLDGDGSIEIMYEKNAFTVVPSSRSMSVRLSRHAGAEPARKSAKRQGGGGRIEEIRDARQQFSGLGEDHEVARVRNDGQLRMRDQSREFRAALDRTEVVISADDQDRYRD
jgi:hypothetical protein